CQLIPSAPVGGTDGKSIFGSKWLGWSHVKGALLGVEPRSAQDIVARLAALAGCRPPAGSSGRRQNSLGIILAVLYFRQRGGHGHFGCGRHILRGARSVPHYLEHMVRRGGNFGVTVEFPPF